MKTYTTEFRISIINWFMAPFAWSRWADIDTFSFGGSAYLLQGKKNRRTNAKKFRVVSTSQIYTPVNIGHLAFYKLKDAGLIVPRISYPADPIEPLTDEEFCKLITEFEGEPTDKVEQIVKTTFSGRELKEFADHILTKVNR